MNDRGLSLTPTEMLKGFLLSKISTDRVREQANDLWKHRILELKELGKEEESDFIKNWLRAQYADGIRERKKDAVAQDFEIIGQSFHKWVREHIDLVGLKKSLDYEDFVQKQFDKFSLIYIRLKQYATEFTPGYEHVYYNANRNFTLQFQLILAAIDPAESREISDAKIRLVARFMDLSFTRRIFHYRTVDYSSILYNLFLLSKKIRRKPLPELRELLREEITGMEFQLDTFTYFGLNGYTIRYMRHILGRLTEFIEVGSGLPSHFVHYVSSDIKNPYDIEHVIANHHIRYQKEIPTEESFQHTRNNIGGLVLLPRDKNRSYNDMTYDQKDLGENLLARSLNPDCYRNNPQFLRFVELHNLPFKPYDHFGGQAIQERMELYRQLASKVWSVDMLE